jgi:hypothetical protein
LPGWQSNLDFIFCDISIFHRGYSK